MGIFHKIAVASCAAALAGPAAAQGTPWSYTATFYVFAAETNVTVGNLEGQLSFSDALDNLDFAGMAAVTASNDTWTFIGDLMYFNLGFENDTPGPAFSRLDTDTKTTILSAYALYRVYETPTASFDAGIGLRYFDTDTTLTLQPGRLSRRSVSDDMSWTDPVIAARAHFNFSDAWSTTLSADYGSFVSDRETYQATLTVNYEFADNWFARFGYRYVNVDNDGEDFRFEQSGPVLGVTYRF